MNPHVLDANSAREFQDMNATFRLVDFEWTRRGGRVDTKSPPLQKTQGWATRPRHPASGAKAH